jgi:hypothetical protein
MSERTAVMATPIKQPGLLDGIGMCTSTLCVAHCVLTPVVLIALPFVGLTFPESELTDRLLAVLAIAVAVQAFRPGFRIHGDRRLMALVVFGVGCLLFAAFAAGEIWGEAGDTLFTMVGGGSLVLAHWLNRSFCKACLACRDAADCAAT